MVSQMGVWRSKTKSVEGEGRRERGRILARRCKFEGNEKQLEIERIRTGMMGSN